LCSLYILLYPSNKCTIICLHLLSIYSTLCSLYIYYICPSNAQLSVNSVNRHYTVQFVHFIITAQQIHNYLFTLTVNIQYTVQFVLFIISVQQMHNYLFTLSIYNTLWSLYILFYLYNKCTIVCLFCQYTVQCAVCTFYYNCPRNAQLFIYSANIHYTVHRTMCLR